MGEIGESIIPAENKISLTSQDSGEIKIPLARSFSDLESIVTAEDPNKLFLRWTPDIEADRRPTAVSRNLAFKSEEAGISAHSFNPYPENGYGLNQKYRLEGNTRAERKYYLLSAECKTDESGAPIHGDDGEPLLKPESIVPIAEITPEVTEEASYRKLAFEAVRGDKQVKPGESMGEIRETISNWTLSNDNAERLRQRAIAGIDKYLELHQAA